MSTVKLSNTNKQNLYDEITDFFESIYYKDILPKYEPKPTTIIDHINKNKWFIIASVLGLITLYNVSDNYAIKAQLPWHDI